MTPHITIASSEAAFLKKAAQVFLESVADAVSARGQATVALSGGSTPKKFFSYLAEPYYRERIPWTKVHFFWGDERCVPPDHADSNYKMAMDALLKKVQVPSVNIHRMPGEMEDPREAAKSYDRSMRLFFKTDRSVPKFDLVLLGLGEDGHTASLFPKTVALTEREKLVVGHHVESVHANRLTVTFPVINSARRVVFLCAGDSKSAIIKEIFRTDLAVDRFPAQRVNPVEGELIWILDSQSAARLPNDVKDQAQHV